MQLRSPSAPVDGKVRRPVFTQTLLAILFSTLLAHAAATTDLGVSRWPNERAAPDTPAGAPIDEVDRGESTLDVPSMERAKEDRSGVDEPFRGWARRTWII